MDLRYTIPPVVSLLSSWNWELIVSSISVQQFSILKLIFEIFAMMLLLLFLFTSAEIPLNLGPIHLRTGHFSIAFTTSLMASLFLPPSSFWAVYLLIVFLSPLHHMFFELLKRFFHWLNGENPTPIDLERGVEPYMTATTGGMDFAMDLRYTIPPVISLLSSWNWELIVSSISVQQFSILKLILGIFAMMLLLLILFTSAEIPLNLGPIHLRAGHFSIAFTTLLLASLFLPPSLFWAVYLLIVFLSPLHHMFFELLKRFCHWLNEENPTPIDLELGVEPYMTAIG